ncbi:hypothetical protein LEP1GSC062_3293 [Leptospira alexanderi serovar Manhao 3 str. L 60]|uniref:Uncharacterized protein n=1 Tax=Leptospira alexanderi serovar Manhao 3 str. L 60 TaxID=1049759 RepID=V6HX81_9LEPT|nr:hypothetical protein LEP1GSC062_3293 [Leptospira alexanderi serovar Manhao 3 str. L 60]
MQSNGSILNPKKKRADQVFKQRNSCLRGGISSARITKTQLSELSKEK